MKVSFNPSFPKTSINKVSPKPVLKKVSKEVCLGVGAACLAGKVAVSMSKNELSDKNFELLLEKNHYKKDDSGDYKKVFSEEEQSQIWKAVDGHLNHKSLLIQKPVKPDEMEGFKEFLKLSGGKALKYSENYFDNLMIGYLNLKRGGIYDKHKNFVQQNPAHQDLVLKPLTNPLKIVECNMLMDYKTNGYKDLNEYLRAFEAKEVQSIPESISKKIDVISDYIETQKIDAPIKVYRTEGLDVLKNVKMSDGSTFDLRSLLNGFISCKDPAQKTAQLQKIKEFVLDNELQAHYPSFLSTSVDNNIFQGTIPGGKGLFWEIEVPKDTKGVYLESLNTEGRILCKENEFLIQKGANILIKSIDYDEKENQWKITGQILN